MKPRVWLYGTPLPSTPPTSVRDDRFHTWTHETGDLYRTPDGHHRCRWSDLVQSTDLIEIEVEPA